MELLVARDDESGREMTVKIARMVGFKPEDIFPAETEEKSLAIICTRKPLIAVIDPHLSCDDRLEDGLHVIQAAVEMNRYCLAICFTLDGSMDLGIRAIHAGACDYIDASMAYVNWVEYLKHKLHLWKEVAELRKRDRGD